MSGSETVCGPAGRGVSARNGAAPGMSNSMRRRAGMRAFPRTGFGVRTGVRACPEGKGMSF